MRATRIGAPLRPRPAESEAGGFAEAGSSVPFRGLGAAAPSFEYDDGRLAINSGDYVASINGHTLHMPVRELALLVELARNEGRVRTRQQLLEAVWGNPEVATVRAVDTAIARLRSTLQQAISEINYVHTHVKVGYRFEPETSSGEGLRAPDHNEQG